MKIIIVIINVFFRVQIILERNGISERIKRSIAIPTEKNVLIDRLRFSI